jgi:hypothetical protein
MCDNGELDVYAMAACNNNQTPLTTTCRDAPDGGYPSYRFQANIDSSGGGGSRCEVDVDSTPTSGELTLQGVSTLCCR